MKKLFKLNKNELLALFFGFFGNIFAKGIILFVPTYSIDDYKYLSTTYDISFLVSQGRWGWALLSQTLFSLGIRDLYSITMLNFLSFFLMSLIGIFICRMWKVSHNLLLSSFIVLLFTTFPYQAEIYTFRVASSGFAFSMMLAFLAVYISNFNLKRIFLSIFLLTISLSIYQIGFSYILVFFSFLILMEYLKKENLSVLNRIKNIFMEKTIVAKLITIFGGFLTYIVLNKIILRVFNVQITKRSQLISFSDNAEIIDRLHKINELLTKIYFQDEVIMPFVLKFFLLAFLASAIFLVSKFLFNKNNFFNSLFNISLFLLIIIVFSIIPILPTTILFEWWPVPRLIAPISLFWCGVIVIFYKKCKKNIANFLIFSFGSILIFGFLGINNHIFIDQIRINKQDENKVNRIILRLEKNPQFKNVSTLAIVGGSWAHQLRTETIYGDMNISAFGANWAKIPMVNNLSGYKFIEPTTEQLNYAKEYCKDMPQWPANESITVINEVGVICL